MCICVSKTEMKMLMKQTLINCEDKEKKQMQIGLTKSPVIGDYNYLALSHRKYLKVFPSVTDIFNQDAKIGLQDLFYTLSV